MTEDTCPDTSRLIRFNVNSGVRVKLTKHGHNVMQANHARLYGHLPVHARPPMWRPREDAEGWSRWQLHQLMYEFGECMSGSFGPVPFETWIMLETEDIANELESRESSR